jgi:N-dimethylarginine dimethylaminohydrolase
MSALGTPSPQPSTPPPLLTLAPTPRPPSFLLCPPPHFGVHYVINPWMSGHIGATSNVLATSQWSAFRDILASFSQIELLPAVPGLPDLVFTANAAVLRGNRAVLSSFRHPERQQEEPHLAAWLTAQGFDFLTLPREIHFEGAGDALFQRGVSIANNLLWFGHGVRSSIKALPYLEQHLGVTVQPLRLADKRFYHLDTCFCPLDRGHLLYYPAAFVAESVAIIEALVPPSHRYAVSDEDAEDFACNAVNLAGQVILNRASSELKQWLDEQGFTVHETATTEFLKAGGSTKCLTLRLDEA